MDNRDDFEQWAENNSLKVRRVKKTNGENSAIYADVDTHCAWLGWQAARNDAWLLRKQAEAVEECYQDMLSLPELLKFTDKEMEGFKCGLQHVKGEALTLRQQADEAENG